jgi:hypothetical protein
MNAWSSFGGNRTSDNLCGTSSLKVLFVTRRDQSTLVIEEDILSVQRSRCNELFAKSCGNLTLRTRGKGVTYGFNDGEKGTVILLLLLFPK